MIKEAPSGFKFGFGFGCGLLLACMLIPMAIGAFMVGGVGALATFLWNKVDHTSSTSRVERPTEPAPEEKAPDLAGSVGEKARKKAIRMKALEEEYLYTFGDPGTSGSSEEWKLLHLRTDCPAYKSVDKRFPKLRVMVWEGRLRSQSTDPQVRGFYVDDREFCERCVP